MPMPVASASQMPIMTKKHACSEKGQPPPCVILSRKTSPEDQKVNISCFAFLLLFSCFVVQIIRVVSLNIIFSIAQSHSSINLFFQVSTRFLLTNYFQNSCKFSIRFSFTNICKTDKASENRWRRWHTAKF